MSKKENWVWMPHAGHFIGAKNCRFHLNTYVGGYIVSTVGELWWERSSHEIHAGIYDPKWLAANKHLKGDAFDYAYMGHFGYDELGMGRTYETMVFKAGRAKREEDWSCCPWEVSGYSELDMEGYNTATDAYKGHLELCKKWSKK